MYTRDSSKDRQKCNKRYNSSQAEDHMSNYVAEHDKQRI